MSEISLAPSSITIALHQPISRASDFPWFPVQPSLLASLPSQPILRILSEPHSHNPPLLSLKIASEASFSRFSWLFSLVRSHTDPCHAVPMAVGPPPAFRAFANSNGAPHSPIRTLFVVSSLGTIFLISNLSSSPRTFVNFGSFLVENRRHLGSRTRPPATLL